MIFTPTGRPSEIFFCFLNVVVDSAEIRLLFAACKIRRIKTDLRRGYDAQTSISGNCSRKAAPADAYPHPSLNNGILYGKIANF
jgi:hypothetical protein